MLFFNAKKPRTIKQFIKTDSQGATKRLPVVLKKFAGTLSCRFFKSTECHTVNRIVIHLYKIKKRRETAMTTPTERHSTLDTRHLIYRDLLLFLGLLVPCLIFNLCINPYTWVMNNRIELTYINSYNKSHTNLYYESG